MVLRRFSEPPSPLISHETQQYNFFFKNSFYTIFCKYIYFVNIRRYKKSKELG